jgi:hypothetical protein
MYQFERKNKIMAKNQCMEPGAVALACNPIYSGGRD